MASKRSLELQHILSLNPRAPFEFDATLHKPDHFPTPDNHWTPGILWQTMIWRNRLLGLKFKNLGEVDCPEVQVAVWSEHPLNVEILESLAQEIAYRCNFDMDLAEFLGEFSSDPNIGSALRNLGGMRPANLRSLYQYLQITIVLQNTTVRRSSSMLANLFEHFGTVLDYDGRSLFAFWTPEVLAKGSEKELQELKVGYRAKSLLRVSEASMASKITEKQLRASPVGDQEKNLLNLYGVGPASVGYILFDVFHRWDRLSHISPWEQKILSKLFLGVDPGTPVPLHHLLEFVEARFGRYRMLAIHYAWQDLFWEHSSRGVSWLEELIRL